MSHLVHAALIIAALGTTSSGPAQSRNNVDLTIVRIEAADLCVGGDNRIEVVVANLGSLAMAESVEVILTIQTPGRRPSAFGGRCNALGAGANARLRFDDIAIDHPSDVLVRAEIDPKNRSADDNRRNNADAVLIEVREPCPVLVDPSDLRWRRFANRSKGDNRVPA